MSMAAEIETPSGKGAGDENFPVGSWLLPNALRPDVAAYYAFARAIDDGGFEAEADGDAGGVEAGATSADDEKIVSFGTRL